MCCWMRKLPVQRASEHDLRSIAKTVPNSIWPSEWKIRSIRTHEIARARIRAVHAMGLLHTEIVWYTSQSPHTIWCSTARPHCHWDWRIGIDCAMMAAEHWVWANEISILFLRRDQCLTHVLTCTHTNFTSEYDQYKTASPRAVYRRLSRTRVLNKSGNCSPKHTLFSDFLVS